MRTVLTMLLVVVSQTPRSGGPIDVNSLSFGTPSVVASLDGRTLRGAIRQLAWSPGGTDLYVQASEGTPGLETVRHYSVSLEARELTEIESQPEWALRFWEVKQDRAAPGLPDVLIEIAQKMETLKAGTGPSGVLDRTGDAATIASTGPNPENLAAGTFANQKARVVRLSFRGQEIAVFVNEVKPVPGLRFSWGPDGSGALVFVGDKGELVFLDQKKHKRRVPEVKDAFLPAWSLDGSRLAYVQKTGRDLYSLVWVSVD